MKRSFVADFEKRLIKFEEELRRLVLLFFNRKDKSTTYDIGNYLSRRSTDLVGGQQSLWSLKNTIVLSLGID